MRFEFNVFRVFSKYRLPRKLNFTITTKVKMIKRPTFHVLFSPELVVEC